MSTVENETQKQGTFVDDMRVIKSKNSKVTVNGVLHSVATVLHCYIVWKSNTHFQINNFTIYATSWRRYVFVFIHVQVFHQSVHQSYFYGQQN